MRPSAVKLGGFGSVSRQEIFSRRLKVHKLGDIGAVIAYPFEIFGHEKHVGPCPDRARILDHVGQHFAKQRIIMLVDIIIAFPDGLGR